MGRLARLFVTICLGAALFCTGEPVQAALPGVLQQCHAFTDKEVPEASALRDDFGWTCDSKGWRSDASTSWIRFDLSAWSDERPPLLLALRHGQFESATLYVEDTDGGIARRTVSPADFEPALFGPYASVALPASGSPARRLILRIDEPDLSSMGSEARVVASADEVGFGRAQALSLALVLGIIIPPFFLSLSLFFALRHRFMLPHAAMAVGMMLALGASNGLFVSLFDLPMTLLVGLVECGYVLIVVTAGWFALTFLEPEALPRSLRRALIAAIATTALVAGSIAIPVPAINVLPDDLYMLSFLPALVVVLAVFATAIARGSRAVWYMVVGWTPAILTGIDMIASGLGLQSDRVLGVGAPFYAMAFEILVTGVGVVQRLILLRRERDEALHESRLLTELAERDPLTGLLNRRAILDRFPDMCAGGFTAMALLDLDEFKKVNDEFGHAIGDQVLAATAEALAPDRDAVVARMGGEEFLVILRGRDALQRAERRRTAITRTIMRSVHGLTQPLTASMGVVLFDMLSEERDLDFARLYTRADELLYEAKRAGRNTFMFETAKPASPRSGLAVVA